MTRFFYTAGKGDCVSLHLHYSCQVKPLLPSPRSAVCSASSWIPCQSIDPGKFSNLQWNSKGTSSIHPKSVFYRSWPHNLKNYTICRRKVTRNPEKQSKQYFWDSGSATTRNRCFHHTDLGCYAPCAREKYQSKCKGREHDLRRAYVHRRAVLTSQSLVRWTS